jgi:hypothetical protein
MNKIVKIKIYKTMVKPGVECRSETQHMTAIDTKRLKAWEMKILMSIYGPVIEQGMWRIRSNQQLQELYKNLDIVKDITTEDCNG